MFGVDVAAIGACLDASLPNVCSHDPRTGRFRKVFLNESEEVIGAVLIGETNDAGLYYKWIRTRSTFPGKSVLHGTNTYAGFRHRMT